nr:reverse transcriptase domain-containing protein [Tanacetum cinerariifolium]
MADRTMEELLQAPTKGYGEAIVIPEILAENFEIKMNLLQLVQANKFHGRENDNPYTHISNFKRMIATLKYRDVSNDAIKLMLFLYSLEDRARIWYEKEPPNSILTWDDLVNKFVNQFFPSSKTTHLKNEISRFIQRFDETFIEIVNKQVIAPAKAVEKTCVTCGGAHAYYECISTDSNPSSVCAETGSYNQVSPPNRATHQIPPPGFAPVQNNPNRINQGIKTMQNQINVLRGDFSKQEENLRRNLNDDMRSIIGSFFPNQPLTSGTLPSSTIPNPKGKIKAVTTRSGLAYEGPSIPTESPLEKVDEQNTEEILDKEHSNSSGSTAQVQPSVVPILIPEPDVLRTQTKSIIPYPSSFADALFLMPKFASTIKSLLANKDNLFELANVPLNENCSAMLLKKLLEKLGDSSKFLIPCDFPGMNVCHVLADLGASINLMPLSIWKKLSLPELTLTRMTLELADRSITRPKGVAEDVFVKVGKFYFPNDFAMVDLEADPRVPLILGRSFLRTGRALIDVYGEEITLRVNDESITFNLDQVMRYYDNFVSRVNVIDIDSKEVVQDNSKSSNPTLVSESDFCEDPIVKTSPFGEKDPFQLPSMNLNQAKSPMEEPKYSFSMGYEHFSTTLVTKLDEVVESSAKNLVPILREYEVTSDKESEYNEPIKNDSFLAFTTFTNRLFNIKDDFTIHDKDVSIEESKIYSNPLFDDDEIYSDELESHYLNVESNFVESLSNHDTLKFDHLKEFSGTLIPIHIVEEERIRREHAEYISLMERLITINPCPRPTVNANTIVESLPSSLIPVQDNDSQREEIDIVTNTDELLPPDAEFDFEPDAGEEISVMMNDNDELECLDPRDEIDVSTNDEDDDYFPFMFVI